MKLPVLKNWYVVELSDTVVMGNVYNHPDHHNGYELQTRKALKIDLEKRLLVCSDRIYSLDEPYSKWFVTQGEEALSKLL